MSLSVDIDIYWVLIELSSLNLLPVFFILNFCHKYIYFYFYSFDFKSLNLSAGLTFPKSVFNADVFLVYNWCLLFESLCFCI